MKYKKGKKERFENLKKTNDPSPLTYKSLESFFKTQSSNNIFAFSKSKQNYIGNRHYFKLFLDSYMK